MFAKILNGKTSTVSGAAIILALSFFLSRVLGIVRDRMLTGIFGAGEDLDAYLLLFAYRIFCMRFW